MFRWMLKPQVSFLSYHIKVLIILYEAAARHLKSGQKKSQIFCLKIWDFF